MFTIYKAKKSLHYYYQTIVGLNGGFANEEIALKILKTVFMPSVR